MSRGHQTVAPTSRAAGRDWSTALSGLAVGAFLGGLVVAALFGVGFWLRDNAATTRLAAAPAPPAVPAPASPKPKPEVARAPAPDGDAMDEPKPKAKPKAKTPEKPAVPEPPKPEPKKPDPPEATVPTFATVAGIFQAKCNSCHGAGMKRGGLDLTSFAALMAGGDGGREVAPGEPDKSYLFGQIDGDSMPPDGRPKLSAGEKARVRAWIMAGAKP